MFSTRAPWLLLTAGLGLACSDSGPGPAPAGTSGGAGGSQAGNGVAAGSGGAAGVGGASGGQAGQAGTAGSPVVGGGTGGSGGGGSGGSGGGGSGGSGGAQPRLEDLHYYGRWDLQQAGKAITVNSGSHITAKFNGTGISAQFDTSGNSTIPTVRIEVDDAPPVEKEIASTLDLVSGLAPGEHTVTLFVRGMSEFETRWTPPLVSATTFLGFTVTGGALVPSARPVRLKMEFLGDSITEGVALHAQGPQGQTTPNWRTDGPRGYASLTARKMNAEWRQVGFGRQGVNIGGNGGVPKVGDAFNWFYAGVPRDDWQADLVVINQGTNDQFNNVEGATFAPLYRSLLELVRAAYPQAKIAALRPLSGGFGPEISAQVSALTAAGDAKVFYIDTAGWTSNGDFTDGVHPNEAGSVKIADKLVDALQALPD
jgi:lysophospholipase L1-like esterase